MSLPDYDDDGGNPPEKLYGLWPEVCTKILEINNSDIRILGAEYDAWRADADHDDWEEQLDHTRTRLLQALQIRALLRADH